ncbi:protelomerase family protein [Streptomyces sp. NRRL F-5193]|uniref:protelomerase family protein n=1 Tax=Streptomyces sp. NRRL F-5193 TaxID=1463860 RepID=UPI0005B97BD6|nr:protelomerase family protein [Streptomyces sp. NRRL F-5193]
MLTPADRKWIDRFLTEIRGAGSDEQKVHLAVLTELSDIHQRVNPKTGEPYALTTNRSLITGYRNVIKAELGENAPVLEKFKHSDAHVAEYRRHQRELREERHRNQRPLNAQEHIERAAALLSYNAKVRWANAAAIAGVVALTGRRPYEVGCVGGFQPDSADATRVLFSGQTKTRETERAASVYSIPVLAERDLVLETVARIREEVDPALDNKTYSQRFGKEVGIVAKRTFIDADGQPLIPRELREAYAAVAYHKFASRKISEVQFYNDVLGHQGTDLNTSLFYFAFYIGDSSQSQ